MPGMEFTSREATAADSGAARCPGVGEQSLQSSRRAPKTDGPGNPPATIAGHIGAAATDRNPEESVRPGAAYYRRAATGRRLWQLDYLRQRSRESVPPRNLLFNFHRVADSRARAARKLRSSADRKS